MHWEKLGYVLMGIVMSCIVTGILFYIIRRRIVIFWGNVSKLSILISSFLLAVMIFLISFVYQGENIFLDILGTICSRLLVLSFIMMIFLAIEHFISIWYKINPRIILGIIIVIIGTWIFFSQHTKVTELHINSEKISKETKILLVSDLHVDHILSTTHIKELKKQISLLQPDFVLIAGDLVNRAKLGYAEYFKELQEIKTPIFAVMGNHDIMGNKEILQKIEQYSSIRFLDNESTNIDGIQLVGIEDKSNRNGGNLKDILEKTEIQNDDQLFTILITHQPIHLSKLEEYTIDLEVAWHTHRGQFFGMRKVVDRANDYGYWPYQHNERTAFVSQGIGTRGLPFRLGTQSEVVLITLTNK